MAMSRHERMDTTWEQQQTGQSLGKGKEGVKKEMERQCEEGCGVEEVEGRRWEEVTITFTLQAKLMSDIGVGREVTITFTLQAKLMSDIIITQVLLATQLSWIDITIGYN